MRRREALALLRAKQYAGAYYLAGYAAECALKSCIAKNLPKQRFPPRRGKPAKRYYQHDINALRDVAGLGAALTQASQAVQANWAIVKDWSEQTRYLVNTEKQARDLYRALTARNDGVLWWMQKHW